MSREVRFPRYHHHIDPGVTNPVDIVARLAALDVLTLIFSPESRSTDYVMPR
jgi:hypothetical protein